jgi:hypothetical protein
MLLTKLQNLRRFPSKIAVKNSLVQNIFTEKRKFLFLVFQLKLRCPTTIHKLF